MVYSIPDIHSFTSFLIADDWETKKYDKEQQEQNSATSNHSCSSAAAVNVTDCSRLFSVKMRVKMRFLLTIRQKLLCDP